MVRCTGATLVLSGPRPTERSRSGGGGDCTTAGDVVLLACVAGAGEDSCPFGRSVPANLAGRLWYGIGRFFTLGGCEQRTRRRRRAVGGAGGPPGSWCTGATGAPGSR